MRAVIFSMVIWTLGSVGATADPKEIQSVIDQQLEAFQADDFAGAMEFASPGLKRYFKTPGNFQQMVTKGYPMVWRFKSVQYLESRVEAGVHWQRVMIRDLQGDIHVLDYRMTETEEGWRINGVQILDSDDYTA